MTMALARLAGDRVTAGIASFSSLTALVGVVAVPLAIMALAAGVLRSVAPGPQAAGGKPSPL